MELTIHNMDEFVVIQAESATLDPSAVVREIASFAQGGPRLIFLDLSSVKNAAGLDVLREELAKLKEAQPFELVLVAEHLAQAMRAAKLEAVAQIYQPKDRHASRQATQALLQSGFHKITASLEALVVEAVNVGVKRWIGTEPNDVKPSMPEVDPLQDFVSCVSMMIDGGEFRLYLASTNVVMQAMVAKVLKTSIADGDPVVGDAACELLNYLSAYFGQRLAEQEAVVETSAPQLLAPDEIMVLLDQSPKGHRVQTALGHFDVWIEEAA